MEVKAFFSQIDTAHDKAGTNHGRQRNVFVEQQIGCNQRDDGAEVDVGGHPDNTQSAGSQVPKNVPEHGGYQAQEQQIQQNIGPKKQA